MENKKKIRVIISVVLFFIIAITTIYLYQHRDKLFTSTYQITYPDRCVEVFENDILISEKCIIGRMIYEEQQNKSNQKLINLQQWNQNLT